MTITIDLGALDLTSLLARSGAPASFVAGALEVDIVGGDFWNAGIDEVRLDGTPIDFDWVDAFDLSDAIELEIALAFAD